MAKLLSKNSGLDIRPFTWTEVWLIRKKYILEDRRSTCAQFPLKVETLLAPTKTVQNVRKKVVHLPRKKPFFSTSSFEKPKYCVVISLLYMCVTSKRLDAQTLERFPVCWRNSIIKKKFCMDRIFCIIKNFSWINFPNEKHLKNNA